MKEPNDKLTLSIRRSRITKVKRHAKRTRQTVSQFLENSIDKIMAMPKGRTWVDELFGSARFTDAEIAGDDRMARLVEGARTKPRSKSTKRS
jgi:hypothetical protein